MENNKPPVSANLMLPNMAVILLLWVLEVLLPTWLVVEIVDRDYPLLAGLVAVAMGWLLTEIRRVRAHYRNAPYPLVISISIAQITFLVWMALKILYQDQGSWFDWMIIALPTFLIMEVIMQAGFTRYRENIKL